MKVGGHTSSHVQAGGGDGNPTFTFPGFGKEIKAGDKLSQEDAEKIVAESHGKLSIKNGHIVGKNPDGSGDVDIEIGKALDAGQIHDLHHTVVGPGYRGEGNSAMEGEIH